MGGRAGGRQDQRSSVGSKHREPQSTAEKPFLNCFCPRCANHSLTLGHLPRAPGTEANVSVCVGVIPLTENQNNLSFTLLLYFIITFSIYSFVYSQCFFIKINQSDFYIDSDTDRCQIHSVHTSFHYIYNKSQNFPFFLPFKTLHTFYLY